ncbi:MAG: hypothetical protein ABSA27_19575, partial [Terriglobales bacterium]
DAASTLLLRGVVGIMRVLRTPNDGSDDSSSPASSRQRLTGTPPLPAKRLEPSGIPLPDAVADDRRNVVWNAHGLAGTSSGSESGV